MLPVRAASVVILVSSMTTIRHALILKVASVEHWAKFRRLKFVLAVALKFTARNLLIRFRLSTAKLLVPTIRTVTLRSELYTA
jgi:hypothetical protein